MSREVEDWTVVDATVMGNQGQPQKANPSSAFPEPTEAPLNFENKETPSTSYPISESPSEPKFTPKANPREGTDIFEDMLQDFCEFVSKEARELKKPTRSCLTAAINAVDKALDCGKAGLDKLRKCICKDEPI